MSKNKQASAHAQIVGQVSTCAQDIAKKLRIIARNSDVKAVNAAESICELIQLVQAAYQVLLRTADSFASVWEDGRTFSVAGRSYSNAHVASVVEARIYLEYLWIKLDPKDWEKRQADWKQDHYSAHGQAFFNGTGLNPDVVRKKQRRACNLTQKILTDRWEADFAHVSSRTVNERERLDSRRATRISATARTLVSNLASGKLGVVACTILSAKERKLFDELTTKKKGLLQEIADHVLAAVEGAHKSDKEVPFVPNKFQDEILRVLDGQALNKNQLATAVCRGEGSRLYRPGGINELKKQGLVKNKPRLGYYRPDAPP